MEKYIILHAENHGKLIMEVNKFLNQKPQYKTKGGPYCEGSTHYQALELKENNQLNQELLLG